MNDCTLTFSSDGQVHGLYTEAVNLSLIGKLSIRRATAIEFDNKEQCWSVYNPAGIKLYSNISRNACLDWEHQHFNSKGESINE